jgi:hypothetical protein
MPRHDHARAIEPVVLIPRRDRGAFVWTQQRTCRRAAELIELRDDPFPVECRNAIRDIIRLDFPGVSSACHGILLLEDMAADLSSNHPISEPGG